MEIMERSLGIHEDRFTTLMGSNVATNVVAAGSEATEMFNQDQSCGWQMFAIHPSGARNSV